MDQTVRKYALDFNANIKSLASLAKKNADNDGDVAEIESMSKKLVILKQSNGIEEPLIRSAPYLVKYNTQLINLDVNYLVSIAGNKELQGFIDIITKAYANAVPADKEEVQKYVTEMVSIAVQYQLYAKK